MSVTERAHLRRMAWALALVSVALALAGLATGSEGWSWPFGAPLTDSESLIVGEIRAPRSAGAWLVGALLGLAGALAQGLFRNPLADPYLLGSASGASLAVVAVLAAGTALGAEAGLKALAGTSLVVAAFVGALGGMALSLLLARGASHTPRLLLAGVVVGVMLGAVNELLVSLVPETLRGRQGFMLGHTGFLSWEAVSWLAPGAALLIAISCKLSRTLDALTLGEESARSLGLPLARLQAVLIALLAAATGLAVSQAGLVAFVGLLAPHLARRFVVASHGVLLPASAALGGALLLAADVLSRLLVAPQELPVGLITAVLGGAYLLWLLRRQDGGRP